MDRQNYISRFSGADRLHTQELSFTAFEIWRPDLSFYHILVPIGYRATALSDASVCLSVTLLPPETRGYVLRGVGRGLVNKHAFFLLLGLRVGRAGGRRPTVEGRAWGGPTGGRASEANKGPAELHISSFGGGQYYI